MNAADEILELTLAAPGIEVVTIQTGASEFVTTIHAPGRNLDGERFTADRDPDSLHHRACLLARMSLWPRRRRR